MMDPSSSPPLSDPQWLTIRDVARRFAVDPRTVRRWIQAGKLRAGRAGPRLVRIHADDLAAFEAAFLGPEGPRPSCPHESLSDRGLAGGRADPPR